MGFNHGYLLLVGEGVKGAGGEGGEGIIGWGENGEPCAAIRVVKLQVNLVDRLRAHQQPYQRLKLPSFL